jgi:hypothetical protein
LLWFSCSQSKLWLLFWFSRHHDIGKKYIPSYIKLTFWYKCACVNQYKSVFSGLSDLKKSWWLSC